jgi:hypothetical protein
VSGLRTVKVTVCSFRQRIRDVNPRAAFGYFRRGNSRGLELLAEKLDISPRPVFIHSNYFLFSGARTYFALSLSFIRLVKLSTYEIRLVGFFFSLVFSFLFVHFPLRFKARVYKEICRIRPPLGIILEDKVPRKYSLKATRCAEK